MELFLYKPTRRLYSFYKFLTSRKGFFFFLNQIGHFIIVHSALVKSAPLDFITC